MIRWPSLSPDGRKLVFSAMNRLTFRRAAPRLLTSGGAEGEFMPAWSPDGQSIVYATWTTTGGHLKRVSVNGGVARKHSPQREGYYLDPAFSPDGSRIVFAGAASDQLYSILMDTPPEDERDDHGPREIGGVSRRTRWRFAGCRPRAAQPRWSVGAGRPRRPLRAQRRQSRLLHDQPRPAVDHDGWPRPPHAVPYHRRRPRQQPAECG